MKLKLDSGFIKKVIYVNFPLLIIGLLLTYLFFRSYDVILGLVYGYILGLIHITIGYFSLVLSAGKNMGDFFKYLVGGMILRIFVLLVIIVFLLKFSSINIISLLISLFIFYFINLTLELNYINKKTKN